MQRLTVLYDGECAVCRRARDWLSGQPTHVPLELLAAGSPAARSRYGDIPWLGTDLVVVDDDGRVWAGPAAFVMCLWATVRHRGLANRLSDRGLAPLAERFFRTVSRRRPGAAMEPADDGCEQCHNR